MHGGSPSCLSPIQRNTTTNLEAATALVTLNAEGIGFTSDAHSWSWPFAQLKRTERRDSKQLRIETTRRKKFNFELRDPIQLVDWSKFLNLAN